MSHLPWRIPWGDSPMRQDRQLFAVVTADAGCGKSTLIRRFVTSLPKEEYLFLYLSDSKLTPALVL